MTPRHPICFVAVAWLVVLVCFQAVGQGKGPVRYRPPPAEVLNEGNDLDLRIETYAFQPVFIVAASDPGHAYRLGGANITQFCQIIPVGWGYQTEWWTFRFRMAVGNLLHVSPPGNVSGGLFTPDVEVGLRPAPAFPVLLRLTGEFNWRVDVLEEEDIEVDYPFAIGAAGADLVWEIGGAYLRGFPMLSAAVGTRAVALWSERYESGGKGDVGLTHTAVLFGGRGDFVIPIEMSSEDMGNWKHTKRGLFLGLGYFANDKGDRDVQWTLDFRAVYH